MLEQWNKKHLTIRIEKCGISACLIHFQGNYSVLQTWICNTFLISESCVTRVLNACTTLWMHSNLCNVIGINLSSQHLKHKDYSQHFMSWLTSTCSLTILHCPALSGGATLPWWIGWNVNWWLQLPQECRLWHLWSASVRCVNVSSMLTCMYMYSTCLMWLHFGRPCQTYWHVCVRYGYAMTPGHRWEPRGGIFTIYGNEPACMYSCVCLCAYVCV